MPECGMYHNIIPVKNPPPLTQWRVKYVGQGQSLTGLSPVDTIYRFGLPSSLWFCDFSQQSRFLTACRRLEKN